MRLANLSRGGTPTDLFIRAQLVGPDEKVLKRRKSGSRKAVAGDSIIVWDEVIGFDKVEAFSLARSIATQNSNDQNLILILDAIWIFNWLAPIDLAEPKGLWAKSFLGQANLVAFPHRMGLDYGHRMLADGMCPDGFHWIQSSMEGILHPSLLMANNQQNANENWRIPQKKC